MPHRWLKSLRAHFEPVPVADPLWRRGLAGCPLARRLDPERQQRLRQLATLFLARKQFHALAGAVLDDYWRLLIAMQACLPALQQGTASLRGWREVLIYPGEFKVRRNHHDGHAGVVATGDEVLIGGASGHDPLVLSLADVQLDLEQPWDGYNVVVHEMAHKLDMLDGPPDGVPPLVEIPRRRWIEQFQLAYDRLASAPADRHDCPIEHYAAESASEYFAVVSELHYSQPLLLRQSEPAIASLLEAFYGRSPAIGCEPCGAGHRLSSPPGSR
ncbi:MAG TPA: M90 family metallopeptidase [Rhodanobacter sp.]|nr:M90 family metallopeptidase [Rhodanobacter sp.]